MSTNIQEGHDDRRRQHEPVPVSQGENNQIYHVRNDSIHSMDSFVRIHDVSAGDLADSFSESLGDEQQATVLPGLVPKLPHATLPHQETIDHLQTLESGVSQSTFQAFFKSHNPSGSDSDGVYDGSVIVRHDKSNESQEQKQIPHTSSATMKSTLPRDRFPSFDSAGSSGSVVKKVVAPRVFTSAHPANPKILPYHERRKLMLQRQMQQQQQQPFVHNQEQLKDHPPPRLDREHSQQDPTPFPVQRQNPPTNFSYSQKNIGTYSPYSQPQSQLHHVGYPTDPFPASHVSPIDHEQSFLPYSRNATQNVPGQKYHQQSYVQQDASSSGFTPSGARMSVNSMPGESHQNSWNISDSRQYIRPPKQQLPPQLQQWDRGSSLDSGADVEQQSDRTRNDGRGTSSESELLHRVFPSDVPPPPPPPPNKAAHISHDSLGSVSSLGSLERSGREENRSENPRLLDRIQRWVVPPRQQNVDDFSFRFPSYQHRMEPRDVIESSRPLLVTQRGPMDRPPVTRGGHRRLHSIENDDGTESEDDSEEIEPFAYSTTQPSYGSTHAKREATQRSEPLWSEQPVRMDQYVDPFEKPNEHTRILPPSGISTNEYADRYSRNEEQNRRDASEASSKPLSQHDYDTWRLSNRDNSGISAHHDYHSLRHSKKLKTKPRKNKKRRSSRKSRYFSSDESSERNVTFPASPHERKHLLGKEWAQRRRRDHIMWRDDMQKEEAQSLISTNRWDEAESTSKHLRLLVGSSLVWIESFFANLPLTIGAIALSIANLGVVWFKFTEVNLDSCTPVHFHSAQCSFPEFPGCFYCDTTVRMYKVAEYFHFCCSCFAGVLALSFVGKLILARRIVFDELSSPTTASPAGLICMTLVIVFAGRGVIGEVVVCTSAFAHLCLAAWFLYLAMAYHMMPEPSWFPATTGLGIPAIKLWLYFPMAGHFLMSVALSLMFVFFPISLLRVYFNRKISATVGWMQMSAPNVALYAVTIMAQPSFEEENPDVNHFQRLHRRFYLPFMTFLFGLCLLGAFASVYSLVVRWNEHSKLPFSHAHAAFCAPSLCHANAVQAYRAAVLSFSGLSGSNRILSILYAYWMVTLVGGTCVTIYIATKYLMSLPKWTHFDIEDDIEPPAPNETAMSLASMVSSGDAIVQPFISPPILQANETGTLVFTRDSHGAVRYARTRKVTALGFEPIMDTIEVDLEREFLLDWVSKNAPRRRHRTLSVPGNDFRYGTGCGYGNTGVYRDNDEGRSRSSRSRRLAESSVPRRPRATTESPHIRSKQTEQYE